MTTVSLPTALDLRACAQKAEVVSGEFPFARLTRTAADVPTLPSDVPPVVWSAWLEWRHAVPDTTAERSKAALPEPQLWLHLQVDAQVPQVCQRCLQPYAEPVNVDRWFRFVASETVALAEDDDCEEDLLAFEPRFDLLNLIEDELLLELPLVPMHETCPEVVSMSTGELPDSEEEKPHPFAALAAFKRSGNTH